MKAIEATSSTNLPAKAAKWAVGLTVWSVEYPLWAAVAATLGVVWLLATLVKMALKVGVLGVLLLCLPIIGWVILAVVWSGRRQRERHHAELMAALNRPATPAPPAFGGIFRVPAPWLMNWIRR